ncbi:MAG: DUF3224 domain-containing protein [Gemmatimonadetes bacterium]|nr:DUF3224 domain-containing protein [Gemmatimonadota bacterium]MBL0178478.1 DUF3224 domain-containing protein [Gemmatimonadota bacterium]
MPRLHASGPFDVKLIPQQDDPATAGPFGRMLLDKHFHGDLEGTSNGQMLAGRTAVAGSAAYVAMEAVTGSLHGRTGTFMLSHVGIMNRGAASLSVSVVPDSGTDELVGLSGTLQINIDAGKHSYHFDYTFDQA